MVFFSNSKKSISFFALCFSMLYVFTEPLSIRLDEAVRLAFQNNVQLSSMAIDLRMKKAEKDYAWNVFLPSIQTTATMARTNIKEVSATIPPMSPPGFTTKLEEKDKWKVMGGLNISLNLNAALFEGLKATWQSYEANLLSYEAARRDTEQNVKKAFYGLLLQEGSLAISKEKLASAQKRKTQMEANFKNALVSELQYLQVQLALETQKPAIMEAELLLAQQKELFAFLLGLHLGTEIVLVGEIAPHIQEFNADELIAEYLGRSFELAQLDKNKELMETQLRATLLQTYTPTIVLSQTFNPALGKIDDDWFKKDNWADTSGAFSLTIAFNLTNLLPFSGMGQNIQKTRDTIEKLELAKKQALHMSEIDIRNIIQRLEKTKAAIEVMKLNEEIARKALRLSEEAYNAGLLEYLDLKDAETSLLQAELGVLSEKFNYSIGLLDLEKAIGISF